MRTSSLFLAAVVVAAVTRPAVRQAEAPEPRAGAFMVYDEAHGQTLLFGGWTRPAGAAEIIYPDDLWAWDGIRWKKLAPAAGSPRPDGRDAPVMAYDPMRRHVVVYGGGLLEASGGFAGFSRSLWEWDGARWMARDTAGLSNHIPGAIAASRDGIHVLLGEAGVNRDGPRVPSPTMTFGRSGWSPAAKGPAFNNLQATAGAPDGTMYFYHAWESWLSSPVLHIRDTTGEWRRIERPVDPGVRNTQAAAWDSRRKRLVLFGGQTRDQQLLGDTWEFDGRDWIKR